MVTHDFLMFLSLKCDHAHLFHSLSRSVSDIDSQKLMLHVIRTGIYICIYRCIIGVSYSGFTDSI